VARWKLDQMIKRRSKLTLVWRALAPVFGLSLLRLQK
jgi:hypothetical protein